MTQRRKALSVLSVVGVLLIGAVAMFLLTSFKAEAAKTEQPAEIRTVRTRILSPGPQIVFIESEGFLKAARRLEVHSSVTGRVSGTLSGLLFGTFLILILLPCVLSLMADFNHWWKSRREQQKARRQRNALVSEAAIVINQE